MLGHSIQAGKPVQPREVQGATCEETDTRLPPALPWCHDVTVTVTVRLTAGREQRPRGGREPRAPGRERMPPQPPVGGGVMRAAACPPAQTPAPAQLLSEDTTF